MKAEITLTDAPSLDDVKAAAIDIQAALQGHGWRFCGARTSPKDKRIVLILRTEGEE